MDQSNEISTAIRKFEPLIEKLNFFELSILNRMVVNRMKLINKAEALIAMSKIQVGDRVSWQISAAFPKYLIPLMASFPPSHHLRKPHVVSTMFSFASLI